VKRGTALNAATRAVADTYAAILRRRTGKTWVVVAGSAEADVNALGGGHLCAGVRGTADVNGRNGAA
jgi:hypothetical protein